MEIKLQNRCREIWLPLSRQTKRLPLNMDAVVPDSMEDLGRIAAVQAAVFLKSKDPGERSLVITGEVRASVLAFPENGEILVSLPLTLPFTMEFETETGGGEAVSQVRLRLTDQQVRLLNGRKLSAAFELGAELIVYGRDSLNVETSLVDPPPGLHWKQEQKEIPVTAAVTEKSFVVSEAFRFEEEPERLLYQIPTLRVDGAQTLGSRAIVKGGLELRVGWMPGGGGTPRESLLRFPFSQVVETGQDDLDEIVAWALPGAAYFDLTDSVSGGKALDTEIHAVLQLTGLRRENVTVLADAYSNHAPLDCEQGSETVSILRMGEDRIQSLEPASELPEDSGDAMLLWAEPVQAENTGKFLRLSVSAGTLYQDATGAPAMMRRTWSAEAPAPGPDEFLAELELSDAGPEAGKSRLSVRYRLSAEESCSLNGLRSLRLREEEAYDPDEIPPLCFVRAGSDSLWELARRCHSSEEWIKRMNPEPEDWLLVLREP